MADKGEIFTKMLHLAISKGVTVRFVPFKEHNAMIKGDRLGLRQDLSTIEDINYSLAHELAHAYLHYDKGDTIKSDYHEQYEEQAAKETEAAYAQKIADIEARERRLLLKEQLFDRGMPKELADIITGTDEKDISAKLDTLQKLYGNAERIKETKATGFQRVGQYNSNSATRSIDPVREAMGLS